MLCWRVSRFCHVHSRQPPTAVLFVHASAWHVLTPFVARWQIQNIGINLQRLLWSGQYLGQTWWSRRKVTKIRASVCNLLAYPAAVASVVIHTQCQSTEVSCRRKETGRSCYIRQKTRTVDGTVKLKWKWWLSRQFVHGCEKWRHCMLITDNNQLQSKKQEAFFTALRGMQTRSSDEISVRPSVKRVHCDRTEEKYLQIFIPCERSFSPAFW